MLVGKSFSRGRRRDVSLANLINVKLDLSQFIKISINTHLRSSKIPFLLTSSVHLAVKSLGKFTRGRMNSHPIYIVVMDFCEFYGQTVKVSIDLSASQLHV